MNIVILTGRLGNDVILRYTQGATAVASFSIATESRYTDKAGDKHADVEWHNIVVFGKQAERCAEFLGKGRLVSVEGMLKSNTYTDKAGVERKVWEIKASTVQFLDYAKDKTKAQAEAASTPAPAKDAPVEDEIPF